MGFTTARTMSTTWTGGFFKGSEICSRTRRASSFRVRSWHGRRVDRRGGCPWSADRVSRENPDPTARLGVVAEGPEWFARFAGLVVLPHLDHRLDVVVADSGASGQSHERGEREQLHRGPPSMNRTARALLQSFAMRSWPPSRRSPSSRVEDQAFYRIRSPVSTWSTRRTAGRPSPLCSRLPYYRGSSRNSRSPCSEGRASRARWPARS